MSRVFFIVLDSFGIGEAPDAAAFGDAGASTIRSVAQSPAWNCPNMTRMGLFNIEGVASQAGLEGRAVEAPIGAFARMRELSMGKDTVIGHWELAGVVSPKPMPTFPDGFPEDFIRRFEAATGKQCIVNKPYSGTEVLKEYGMEQKRTGALIVYTSADSVFQIAANEADVPVKELYRYCEIARKMLVGDMGVGRVIARPYIGDSPDTFVRTANRHDYALEPPQDTILDKLKAAGRDVIGVGKIFDIFSGRGITEYVRTQSNADGMEKTSGYQKRDFDGLCFVNLVETDAVYGHRRNIDGYAKALSEFDQWLSDFMPAMRPDDLLVISADHGCDPGYMQHTDHTREYVELLLYGKKMKPGTDFGTVDGFTFAADMVMDFLA